MDGSIENAANWLKTLQSSEGHNRISKTLAFRANLMITCLQACGELRFNPSGMQSYYNIITSSAITLFSFI